MLLRDSNRNADNTNRYKQIQTKLKRIAKRTYKSETSLTTKKKRSIRTYDSRIYNNSTKQLSERSAIGQCMSCVCNNSPIHIQILSTADENCKLPARAFILIVRMCAVWNVRMFALCSPSTLLVVYLYFMISGFVWFHDSCLLTVIRIKFSFYFFFLSG